jgi:hypothetical protein
LHSCQRSSLSTSEPAEQQSVPAIEPAQQHRQSLGLSLLIAMHSLWRRDGGCSSDTVALVARRWLWQRNGYCWRHAVALAAMQSLWQPCSRSGSQTVALAAMQSLWQPCSRSGSHAVALVARHSLWQGNSGCCQRRNHSSSHNVVLSALDVAAGRASQQSSIARAKL